MARMWRWGQSSANSSPLGFPCSAAIYSEFHSAVGFLGFAFQTVFADGASRSLIAEQGIVGPKQGRRGNRSVNRQP